MISVSHLSIQFSGFYLFNDVSFLVQKVDRIGLTGKNGAGKSTLLKILAGQQEPEKGEIARPNDLTLGYLPQEMMHLDGKNVFEETLSAFEDILKLELEVHRISDEMGSRTDIESKEYHDLMVAFNDANEQFAMQGGYLLEGETEKILLGLGFSREDFTRQTSEFSGGWRMRIELAKILLKKPDVILLDEPTNHLDIESIQWLEQFLKNYSGAIVLVSHDKVFLDTITNRTIEISLGKIYDYKASYSKYLEMRAERRALQMSAYENQQKQLKETEDFIDRFRAKATKARQVQSRVKLLDKVERIEIEDEDNSAMHFRFPEPPRSGKVAISSTGLSKSYGLKEVLKDINFEVERGDHVAFVGKNGEGKSTLSKILAGKEPFTGELIHGHNIHIGYYAQNQAETLNSNKTVFEIIDDAATGEMRSKVRSLLGAFLFSGESVDKKVKVLSGGEKSRLALAKLLLEPINLLIMDEPTNHLDMRSKDILKEALMNYTGALIIVSHDRDFLQGLTKKVFEFKNKNIRLHLGDVYEYLKARKIENLSELERNQSAKSAAAEQKKIVEKAPEMSREEKRQLDNKISKIEKQISTVEAKIEKSEAEIAGMEIKLASAENYQEAYKNYQVVQQRLQAEMKEWEKLNQELADVKK